MLLFKKETQYLKCWIQSKKNWEIFDNHSAGKHKIFIFSCLLFIKVRKIKH